MNTRSYANGAPIILPDGTEFPFWQDETEYRRMHYVDQQHPGASDSNSGTEEAPFLTVQRAAEVVEPAEKVLIKSGIYREWVQPRRSGNGVDEMISFEAAPGAEAIIRGSQVLGAKWTNSDVARSVSVWMVDLPEEFFEGDPKAIILLPWSILRKRILSSCAGRAVSADESLTHCPGPWFFRTVDV